jgi:hypothetical protein
MPKVAAAAASQSSTFTFIRNISLSAARAEGRQICLPSHKMPQPNFLMSALASSAKPGVVQEKAAPGTSPALGRPTAMLRPSRFQFSEVVQAPPAPAPHARPAGPPCPATYTLRSTVMTHPTLGWQPSPRSWKRGACTPRRAARHGRRRKVLRLLAA